MASNREERRQQRLRGAQRQPAGSLDFALSIPAAPPQPKSTRKRTTPQPGPPPRHTSQDTPSARAQAFTKPGSIKPTPKRGAPDATPRENVYTAKRRKLEATSSSRNARSPREPKPRLENEEESAGFANDGPVERLSDMEDELAEEEDSMHMLSLQKPTSGRFDEVAESPRNAPGSGQRHTVGLSKAQSAGILLQGSIRATPKAKAPLATMLNVKSSPLFMSSTPQAVQAVSDADALDELSPDQPVPRSNKPQPQFSDAEEIEEEEDLESLETSVQILNQSSKKSRAPGVENRPLANNKPVKAPVQRKPAIALPKKSQSAKPKRSPAVQRQPKKKKAGTTNAKPDSKESIPVAVYRFTKAPVHGEDDSDADILNSEIPLAKRSGVNAVDVLAQMAEEVIESALDNLQEGAADADDGATKREYIAKFKAVESFQAQLRLTLLQLTTALDDEYSLAKRVKASLKERNDLRAELLRIRAERQQVALTMDEVRIKHESSSKLAQEKLDLNNTFHDIDLAITAARENAPHATELAKPPLSELLKTAAADVSSTSKEGGLLKQVKDFNAFLERAALALEGRE